MNKIGSPIRPLPTPNHSMQTPPGSSDTGAILVALLAVGFAVGFLLVAVGVIGGKQ